MKLKPIPPIDFKQVKRDLIIGIKECSERGLSHTVKWLSEINYSISHIKLSPEEYPTFEPNYDNEAYYIAKSYLDLKEYDRCTFFTEDSEDLKCIFLNLYSRYLSIEKKKLDCMTDDDCPPDPTKDENMKRLCVKLRDLSISGRMDAYCSYLFGVVLKKLDLSKLAIGKLIECITQKPFFWGAWQELALLIPDRMSLNRLDLPDHWIRRFFLAQVFLEQLSNEESLRMYQNLSDQGFNKSPYIMAQMAITYHNRRDLEKAISTFKHLLLIDPYRLDNLDTYSNLLYVKEMKVELAALAHDAVEIDKFRVETCCVIGNYYSLRSEHQKAVLYFQRALKLNPQYLSAWTLMGHEFMEIKNTPAAIHSYRKAIEVNRRDYRAWYGLGQTYEILKMPFYSLTYYKQAQLLRPNDSRMIIALGETYEKLNKDINACKCFYKAMLIGDSEGNALIKLAKLYHKLNDRGNAASAYLEFVKREDQFRSCGFDAEEEFYNAYHYLAQYYLEEGNLDVAHRYSTKCVEHDETKERGKLLLREISARRGRIAEPIPATIAMESEMETSDMVFSP